MGSTTLDGCHSLLQSENVQLIYSTKCIIIITGVEKLQMSTKKFSASNRGNILGIVTKFRL